MAMLRNGFKVLNYTALRGFVVVRCNRQHCLDARFGQLGNGIDHGLGVVAANAYNHWLAAIGALNHKAQVVGAFLLAERGRFARGAKGKQKVGAARNQVFYKPFGGGVVNLVFLIKRGNHCYP